MKLPRLSGHEVMRILAKAGYIVARQKGSPVILVQENKGHRKAVVVPNHREIDKGTLLEIIRQSDLTKSEFLEMSE